MSNPISNIALTLIVVIIVFSTFRFISIRNIDIDDPIIKDERVKKIFNNVKQLANTEYDDDGSVRKDIVNAIKRKNNPDISIEDINIGGKGKNQKYYKVNGYENIVYKNENELVIDTKVINKQGKLIKINSTFRFVASSFENDIANMF